MDLGLSSRDLGFTAWCLWSYLGIWLEVDILQCTHLRTPIWPGMAMMLSTGPFSVVILRMLEISAIVKELIDVHSRGV